MLSINTVEYKLYRHFAFFIIPKFWSFTIMQTAILVLLCAIAFVELPTCSSAGQYFILTFQYQPKLNNYIFRF